MTEKQRLEPVPQALLPAEQAGEGRGPDALRQPTLSTRIDSFLAYAHSFPLELSAAQKRWGLGIYQEMRTTDACVMACERKLKQEILKKNFKVMPKEDADAREIEIADYEERCLENMATSIEDVAWQMLDAIAYGHTMSDIVWGEGVGTDSKYDVLHEVTVIPYAVYTIVLDVFGRFMGVIGRQPGKVPLQWVGPIVMNLNKITGFIPWWKICLFTHSPVPGDLRGTSRFDGAYNAFRAKKDNWANWLYFQRKYGRPQLFLELPATAEAKNPLSTPEQEWADIIANREGDVIAMPPGAKATYPAQASGWQPYGEILSCCNREIALAITTGQRSVTEGETAGLGNSDASVGQETVTEDTEHLGARLCRAITAQILRPLVQARFGDNAPVVPLTLHSDRDEFNETAQALNLQWSDLDPEQQDEIAVTRLNIKPSTRSVEDRLAERQQGAGVAGEDTDEDAPMPRSKTSQSKPAKSKAKK